MNQRRFLVLAMGAALGSNAALLRAQPSPGILRRVGVLAPSTRAKEEITLKPFFDQMRELGWVESQNITYDRVYADDRHEMLGRLAAELAARKPEVIFAPPVPAALAAKRATQTIPIVFGAVGDAVALGLVTSLARPGGNVTGFSSVGDSLAAKRVELLREILPAVKRIGLLVDPTDPSTKLDQQALAPLAPTLGLTIVPAEAANPADVDAAVGRLIAARVEAIFAAGSVQVYNMRTRVIEQANQQRVPVIGTRAVFADDGALFAYGTSLADQIRRSALVVDKILKGAKAADIPVEQPTVFEFVVNLKAAKALGIAIPRTTLLRADRVIE
jgi:putative tryptophan/tyrosine transport system substrate-binding protein